MADYDARIVDLYEEDDPDGVDHDFYREVADREEARSILDPGRITVDSPFVIVLA